MTSIPRASTIYLIIVSILEMWGKYLPVVYGTVTLISKLLDLFRDQENLVVFIRE